VANNFAPVRAPPIPPSGPIVVQTQRVKAQASRPTASAFAPPPSDEVPTPPEMAVRKRMASNQSLHSAGSRGSMTSIGGHGPPRKQMQMPPPAASEVPRGAVPRRPAGAAPRPAGRPSGGRRIVATSLAQHQSLNGIVPRPPPGPRPPRRGPPG